MPTPEFLTSAAEPRGFLPPDELEIAFVGRSNSGKSSALNVLAGVRKLARVSKTPGRTQLVNFFRLVPGRRLVDLPGYGFAKVPPAVHAQWRALLEAYLGNRPTLRGLVITVDIRRGLTDLDRQMLAWAESLGLRTLILLTKADKLSRGQAARRRFEVAAEAPAAEPIVFSALNREGLGALKKALDRLFLTTDEPSGTGNDNADGPQLAADRKGNVPKRT